MHRRSALFAIVVVSCADSVPPPTSLPAPEPPARSAVVDEPMDQPEPSSDPEASLSPSPPPEPTSCDDYLFDKGLREQLATRPDDGLIRFALIGLEAESASREYVLANGLPFDQALFDCQKTAVRVYPAGAFFTPTDEASVRSKAKLWGATHMKLDREPGGLVLSAEGTNPDAAFMVLSVRAIDGRDVYCEGTSKTDAGRDAMRAVCKSLRTPSSP